MNVYVTLDQLKEYIGTQQQAISKDDNRLRQFCHEASRSFDMYVTNGCARARRFFPMLATKVFDHPTPQLIMGASGTAQAGLDTLLLREDILEAEEVLTDNGDTLIDLSDYSLLLYPDGRNGPPFNAIQLSGDGVTTQFSYASTKVSANRVTGIWGWHDDWPNAWADSDDDLSEAVDLDDDILEVDSISDFNTDGLAPRFQALQLLKVEEEYMGVISTDLKNNTLKVRRAMNGSEPATHAIGVTIYTYKPPQVVVLAAKVLTAYLYRRKDSIGTPDERPLAAAQGVLIMPPVLPQEVRDILSPLKKHAL